MKRAFLYLFVLAVIFMPCLLNADDISVIGNIPTDSLIDSVALSPNTGMAYGIDKQTKNLYVIDLNTHTVIKTVPLARRPIGVAVNPSNNLAYVTLKAYGLFHKKGSLCTIDSDGTILNTLTINGDSHGIAVNPENNTIVIALEREKKLLVLSADTLEVLQEISLPYKPRLVALDTDSNRAVVTAGKGLFSWWQHIIMIVDINSGTVLNTINLKRGIKGIAVDTGKDIGVTTGLREINLFDISSGNILSNIKDGDNYLSGIKLKGNTDNPEDDENINDTDINTNITSFLSLFNIYNYEIDEAIIGDLRGAGNGLSDFQNDSTYGLDINQSTHIAVITGEESLLLLDLNTNTLNEYPITDIKSLRAVAVDKIRNTALVSYSKDKPGNHLEAGLLEIQLLNKMLYIASIDPSEAKAGTQDLIVSISGSGFTDTTKILINDVERYCTYINDIKLQITITAEDLEIPCQIEIKAVNPAPEGGVSNTVIFTVLNPETEPPAINITSPQNGSMLYSSPITVSGTVDDNAVSVYVNSIQASISTNTFSATIPLVEGDNVITAIATDQYGQTGSSSITVILASKGSVAGTVTSALTGLAVSSATVMVTDSLNNINTTLTDVNGGYSFVDIEPGAFNMTIIKTGYNQYAYIGTLSDGDTLTVNATLTAIAPVISNIAVTSITSDSATITWTTDQPSDSLVEYGQTTAYGSLASDSTLTTYHTVVLTGLIPSATYHNRTTSTTAIGASATSSDFTFQTEGQETIAITITAPTDGSTIDISEISEITVKGYITNITGNETGVNINGTIAELSNNNFSVNHVPVTEGINTITVTAVDTSGATVTKAITVNAVPTANYISISANPESAAAPMDIFLRINGSFTISNPLITVNGPGSVEQLPSDDPEEYAYKINTDGIYYFIAQAIDPDGNTYQDTIAVTALNLVQIDTLLRAKWAAFTGAMQQKDTEAALNMMLLYSRDRYQIMFDLLKDQLPDIVATYVGLELESISEGRAWYELTAMEGGSLFAYRLGFIQDTNGLWYIREF